LFRARTADLPTFCGCLRCIEIECRSDERHQKRARSALPRAPQRLEQAGWSWSNLTQTDKAKRRSTWHTPTRRSSDRVTRPSARATCTPSDPSFAPDAVHSAPGNNPIAGEYKGIGAILAYYGKLFELSDGTFTAELKSASAEGDDKVVATHHDSAQRGGKTLDQDETLTFTIAGGKITRLVENHSDRAAYDAFWS
jgi:ketosteroid isomerase-like protein